METVQFPRKGKKSLPVLGKMSVQEKNNTINRVAERTKALVHQKQPSPNQKMIYLVRCS